MDLFIELALKMTMTAVIVVTASVLAERSGPFVGAIIAALPTAAGAAYIILALEHPPSFIAESAVGSITANAAVVVFSFVYAALAQRQGVAVSLTVAMLIWFACVALSRTVQWTVAGALLLSALVFAALIPAGAPYRTEATVKVETRTSDLVWRALAVGACVVVVTGASHSIGSFASGMFALFPVVVASLLVIVHLRLGGPAAASVAAHLPVPLIGLTFGFLAVHYLVEPIGVWWALVAGLALCCAWSTVLWFIRQTRAMRLSRLPEP